MKTYRGSCFCGAVAFEAAGDLADGTMRCNCRFCRKMRYWEMKLPDPKWFRLLKGASALSETPRSQGDGINMHHWFCGTCGARLWTDGDMPELGGRFVQVVVSALDNATEAELAAAPIHWANGADDDWLRSAPRIGHL